MKYFNLPVFIFILKANDVAKNLGLNEQFISHLFSFLKQKETFV